MSTFLLSYFSTYSSENVIRYLLNRCANYRVYHFFLEDYLCLCKLQPALTLQPTSDMA
jgi:hypothetical protein